VAAAYTLRPEQRVQGIPTHWNLYVAVENADTTAERAAGLGAKVIAEPFDVYDVGRMAVVQDPTGAVFSLWQAKRHSGFGIKGAPGTFCVADLSTSDQDGASRFYEQLFGWHIGQEDETPAHNHYHLFNNNQLIGGIPPANVSQSWGAITLADLLAGHRLRRGSHKSQKPWRETLRSAHEN